MTVPAKRPRYNPNGPLCHWCGNEVGAHNLAHTWYDSTQLPGVMAPVCGPDCRQRPAEAPVFDYDPVRVGQGGKR